MDVLSLLFDFNRSTVGMLTLDLLDSETLRLPGAVTRYPIESRSEISDHVFLNAPELKIQGQVTASSISVLDFTSSTTKMMDAIEAIEYMRDQRQPVRIVTGLRAYDGFVIENAEVNRTGQGGRGNILIVSIDLCRVDKVTLRQTELPPEQVAPPAQGRAGGTTRSNQTSSTTSQANSTQNDTNPNSNNTLAYNLRRAGGGNLATGISNTVQRWFGVTLP